MVFGPTSFGSSSFKISTMNPVIKIVSFILLAGVLLYISCKKETSCVGCAAENKKSPTSIEGPA